ncbi:HigA family addiction module antitoxin [Neorhizobium galegae]|uniref:Plasmid maintenance system antidote protein, XRE family n=1 Tax=Neorhizobium galegae bv. orientalis str. HAMBI 540 TaxID=1028800 RepID=A0A068SLF4_NEOGA|nr:HigA family addiction module antitoxin [Neorhizobium galegae]CDN47038.1 Plasmid maintenance system antidote protein, XRE family [Neorhizobium galegae bv. orientalis str. HAMBI 540]
MDYKTPGQLIEALLAEKGWSQRSLAVILERGETSVNKVISGQSRMSAEMAIALEEVFSVKAERFLELQHKYDLAKARIEARPNPDRANRAKIYGDLPVAKMIERGWILADGIRDTDNVERELCRFFGVNRLEDAEILPHAARKTQTSIEATPAQMAWLYRVKSIAEGMLVGTYSPQAVEAAIANIRPLLGHAEHMRRVPRILAEAGIRFVVVEGLPGGKIDGACFWLNERSPVIGMTLRFDRIDNFVFVLRHEMEHVKNRDGLNGGAMLDVDLGGDVHVELEATVAQQEAIANAAAAEYCIPSKMMDAFIKRKAPYFSEVDLIGFARTMKVHPGIVAGQLQKRTDQYHKFRQHLVNVREFIVPSAETDGWGDIHPIES